VYPNRGIFKATGVAYTRLMGLFRVVALLTGPSGQTATPDLLVDTGATFTVLPRKLAMALRLVTIREQPVRIAGGRREVWPLAEVRIELAGRTVTTPCLIAPDGHALLGAVTLESLCLGVDPVARRLIEVDGFVGASSAIAPPLALA
jgi:predicted aspartyl protease